MVLFVGFFDRLGQVTVRTVCLFGEPVIDSVSVLFQLLSGTFLSLMQALFRVTNELMDVISKSLEFFFVEFDAFFGSYRVRRL